MVLADSTTRIMSRLSGLGSSLTGRKRAPPKRIGQGEGCKTLSNVSNIRKIASGANVAVHDDVQNIGGIHTSESQVTGLSTE